MIAEVESVEMSLLTEQNDQGTTGPVETLAKQRPATKQSTSQHITAACVRYIDTRPSKLNTTDYMLCLASVAMQYKKYFRL